MDIMTQLEPVQRLSRDLRKASGGGEMTTTEVRFLVDAYYMMQDNRIRCNNQIGSMSETEEPCIVLHWLADQARTMENQIKAALNYYSNADPLGQWARSQIGVGEVIAAGLLAHIDITKAPTVGNIWSFAGLDPTAKWEKGQKRPWNARLKTLCWNIGQSFMKFHNNENCFYGHIYAERKAQEVSKNLAGDFADTAERTLKEKKFSKTTEAYKAYIKGRLPDGRIELRAERYAVKLFLAHYHEVAYKLHYGKSPPLPYPIAHLNHAHKIEVPI